MRIPFSPCGLAVAELQPGPETPLPGVAGRVLHRDQQTGSPSVSCGRAARVRSHCCHPLELQPLAACLCVFPVAGAALGALLVGGRCVVDVDMS